MEMFVVFLILMHVFQYSLAVVLYEGEEYALLPCKYDTSKMYDPIVVWSRYDLDPSTIHRYQQEGDTFEGQNQQYRGRTSMMSGALNTGDLSLNLTKLKISDSGIYTCTVSDFGDQEMLTDVLLQVKERFPPWVKLLLISLGVTAIYMGLVIFSVYLLRCFYSQERCPSCLPDPEEKKFYDLLMDILQTLEHGTGRTSVREGEESVELLFKTKPNLPNDIKVKWIRYVTVEMYSTGSGDSEEQDEFYKGRTEINHDLLKTGDLTLTLKNPRVKDTGRYICIVYGRDTEILKPFELKVTATQENNEAGDNSNRSSSTDPTLDDNLDKDRRTFHQPLLHSTPPTDSQEENIKAS